MRSSQSQSRTSTSCSEWLSKESTEIEQHNPDLIVVDC